MNTLNSLKKMRPRTLLRIRVRYLMTLLSLHAVPRTTSWINPRKRRYSLILYNPLIKPSNVWSLLSLDRKLLISHVLSPILNSSLLVYLYCLTLAIVDHGPTVRSLFCAFTLRNRKRKSSLIVLRPKNLKRHKKITLAKKLN